MGILWWVVVGLIVGFLAGVVVKGSAFGFIGHIIIGVLGGFLGGFIGYYFFHIGGLMSGITLTSVLVAFLGAVVLLFLLHLLVRKKAPRVIEDGNKKSAK